MDDKLDYNQNVFINCPFDPEYNDLFEAIVFCVFDCGFFPRCAWEITNSSDIRIHKIMDIVEQCKLGIHDISRTELNKNSLPRFNMPLELGLFLGAARFGSGDHKSKSCLVLDVKEHRYQEFISDISGQDIKAHNGEPKKAISAVRNWLLGQLPPGEPHPPGGSAIHKKFVEFSGDLPGICAKLNLATDEYTFVEYARMAATWLKAKALL